MEHLPSSKHRSCKVTKFANVCMCGCQRVNKCGPALFSFRVQMFVSAKREKKELADLQNEIAVLEAEDFASVILPEVSVLS